MALIRACRLTIHFANANTYRGRPLSAEILHRARRAGVSGATVLEGIEGYGDSVRVYPASGRPAERSPISVHVIDSPERIRAFLPDLDELLPRCLVVCDTVEILVPDWPSGRRDPRAQ
jgi:PII-like signaling protein